MDAKGKLVLLLALDEMVLGTKLLEHLGHGHGAAVC
jgi:hypothetical protein